MGVGVPRFEDRGASSTRTLTEGHSLAYGMAAKVNARINFAISKLGFVR